MYSKYMVFSRPPSRRCICWKYSRSPGNSRPGYQLSAWIKVNGYFQMGPKFYLPMLYLSAGREKPVVRIFVSKQVDSDQSEFFYLHILLSR